MAIMENHDTRKRLQTGINFSHHDLEANRAGQLSTMQRLELERAENHSNGVFWLLVVINGAMFVGLLGSNPLSPLVVCFLAFTGVLMVIWIIQSMAEHRRQRNSIQLGLVSTAEGVAKTSMGHDAEGSVICTVTIGTRHFASVSTHVYNAFEPGRRYRVYYLNGRILSAEEVGA